MVLICLLAFFGTVAAVNGVMIRAALSTFGGLETESSYKAGLTYAREEAAAEAQDARHWRVTAHLGSLSSGETKFELSATDAAGLPLVGFDATALLEHPTNRRLDHPIKLHPSGAGRFAGEVATTPGQWDLIIELARNGERKFRSRERIVLTAAGVK
jgi:nitrogen fixation protein FixH